MKKSVVMLFAISLFIATPSSFAFPVKTGYTGKQETKQTPLRWIESYNTEIQMKASHSKDIKEITNPEEVVKIINAINAAYDVETNTDQHMKLGALQFNTLDAIRIYLSKDKSTVYLHADQGIKAMTSKNFYQLFQSSIEAVPIPPGYEPEAFPPLPKGEGIDSKGIEKVNGTSLINGSLSLR